MSTSFNLLSYMLADQQPPFARDEFWGNWPWFTRPVLEAYARRGAAVTERNTLPPLMPGDLFAAFKLQCRRALDRLTSATAVLESAGQQPSADEYLRIADEALRVSTQQALLDTFGEAVAANNEGNEIRPWVRNLTGLVDPYSFPLESVVYEKQQAVANAIEMIEQNTAALEAHRRERVTANLRLYEEVQRLNSAAYAIEQLPTNLGRVVSP